MATRDIYETGFDEDVKMESSANQCPECDGRVTTNAVETVCEDCDLVIDEQRINHGPGWRAYDDKESERTCAPLTAARHDGGLSTEIGSGTDAKGNESPIGSSGSVGGQLILTTRQTGFHSHRSIRRPASAQPSMTKIRGVVLRMHTPRRRRPNSMSTDSPSIPHTMTHLLLSNSPPVVILRPATSMAGPGR
ncbi:TFIIB-type zinc ribbon-containing protein [Halodesulfurarchaeum sp. HSR-GB]|nr:TFIIB-type zinc ribbon-containing protein [Halodesulfurarchaeum sp. HSR-GB]MDR5657823.1 TFIIB-type zinc ribbon-containing protein [Halodesulfurarchaeum sp. HSR-GB]